MLKKVSSHTRNSIDKPANFSVKRSSVFDKDLKNLPKGVRDKIEQVVQTFKGNPKSPVLDIESMKGFRDILRIKVGRYRIIVIVAGNDHILDFIATRESVYDRIKERRY